MRIVLWHGYLLSGTGSNVYTQALAREWARAGHDVTVLSQEPRPEQFDLAGAKVVRPDIGGLLPVFVLDRYEGLEPKLLQDFTLAERERYVAANAEAVRAELPADVVFVNHVLLGPVGAPAACRFVSRCTAPSSSTRCAATPSCRRGGGRRYGVQRRCTSARRTSAACSRKWSGMSTACTRCRPASTSTSSRPAPRDVALAALLDESRRDPPNPGNADERPPDEGNAGAFERWFADDAPTVLYFGKLLYNKGVHVLFDALRRSALAA